MKQRSKGQMVKATQGWRSCVLCCREGGLLPSTETNSVWPRVLLPEPVAPISLLDLCLLLLDETSYLYKTGVGLRNSSVREVLAVLVWDLSFILRTH